MKYPEENAGRQYLIGKVWEMKRISRICMRFLGYGILVLQGFFFLKYLATHNFGKVLRMFQKIFRLFTLIHLPSIPLVSSFPITSGHGAFFNFWMKILHLFHNFWIVSLLLVTHILKWNFLRLVWWWVKWKCNACCPAYSALSTQK